MGDKRKMTEEELNILSKIKVRPVEEQRDYLLEQNMLLTGKNATLEKENAELKETVTKMNNVITETFRNLSKAKEIIKDLLGSENTSCEEEMFFEIRQKAEQFLNEVDK